MKIAYVINSVEGGGAALPVPAIVDALRTCGAEIRIFALTRRDGRALARFRAAGLSVAVRDGSEGDHHAALRWLDRSVAAFGPAIIWTSLTRATLLGQLVGARRRVPVVSWQHAAFLRPANRRLLRATRRLTALWIGDSQSVSEFAGRELGVPRSRLATWPIFAADPSAPQATPWQHGDRLRIASLGRLHRVKGYDVLIAALARLGTTNPPIELTIAGEGETRQQLADAVTEAGLGHVELAGFVADPRAFLARQHLYVQPSRSEGFCGAAHEAMQAGLPVVGSAVGEMANSIMTGVTGYLVPPGDDVALSAALATCLAQPEALHAMGRAGRDRLLADFSADRFQRSAEAIYSRLAALYRPSPSLVRPANDRSA
ncbi:MAG: glycosyltransferase family 4 protein [Sphingomonas bacterium]|nr:glycosyltransferase family 4 protein [Sphingomonas bacterium]